ncbi:MAG: M23 family metallopeptidase [Acidobacteriota bacterium]
MRRAAVLAMVLVTLPPAPGRGGDLPDAKQQGRAATASFYERRLQPIVDSSTPELLKQVGGANGLAAFRDKVERELGPERSVLDEQVDAMRDGQTYSRLASFEKLDRVLVQWSFDAKGTITGFLIVPAPKEARTMHLEYATKTPLRLPFDGPWTVFWGGRTIVENYHAQAPDQRFAYDFVVTKAKSTHAGDGARNEDYFCYGKPILAPGDGIVVAAQDGVKENIPGVMNAEQVFGNHVVLDHGNGEFSFLCHFQNGSVRVKVGDRVKRDRPSRCAVTAVIRASRTCTTTCRTAPSPSGARVFRRASATTTRTGSRWSAASRGAARRSRAAHGPDRISLGAFRGDP